MRLLLALPGLRAGQSAGWQQVFRGSLQPPQRMDGSCALCEEPDATCAAYDPGCGVCGEEEISGDQCSFCRLPMCGRCRQPCRRCQEPVCTRCAQVEECADDQSVTLCPFCTPSPVTPTLSVVLDSIRQSCSHMFAFAVPTLESLEAIKHIGF